MSLKKNPLFLRVTAGMLTLGKVPETNSVFPTMLSILAQSRIVQCCVSKRNSFSEPGLFWYPCATADMEQPVIIGTFFSLKTSRKNEKLSCKYSSQKHICQCFIFLTPVRICFLRLHGYGSFNLPAFNPCQSCRKPISRAIESSRHGIIKSG